MNYSPWGKIQYSNIICRGCISVSTAGHGGIGITQNFAEREKFPISAKDKAIKKYGRYWFEEDCDAYIVFYFSSSARKSLYDSYQEDYKKKKSYESFCKDIMNGVKRWNATLFDSHAMY